MCHNLYIFIEKEMKLMEQNYRKSLENEKKRRTVEYSKNFFLSPGFPEEDINVEKETYIRKQSF